MFVRTVHEEVFRTEMVTFVEGDVLFLVGEEPHRINTRDIISITNQQPA